MGVNLTVKPEFHFSGKGWNWLTRYLAKRNMIPLYNASTDQFNALIDGCNQAFTRLYGKLDVSEGAYQDLYFRFVDEYMNARMHIGNSMFRLVYSDAFPVLELVKHPGSIMEMLLNWNF